MSLGVTDKIWWNRIITWLSGSAHRQLIVFLHIKDYSTNSLYEYIEIEDELIEKFKQYSNNKDIEDLRRRIHLAINKDIFAIDLEKEHREMMESAINQLKSNALAKIL